MTMPDDRQQRVSPGPVAIIGQSGGLAMAIKRTLEERGVDTGAVITSGNESGLTTADYIAYFASLPEIKVIVSYLESVHDAPAFLAACRTARAAGKPVVVVKLGASDRRARGGACAYRTARGIDGGVRCGGGTGRRHPRAQSRRRGRGGRIRGACADAARRGARRDHVLRRLARHAARCRVGARAEIPAARARDAEEARGAADGRHASSAIRSMRGLPRSPARTRI